MSLPDARTAHQTVDAEIGQRLRALRRDRSLSLEELAEQTSLSIGFISQIERGLSSPTLRALTGMTDALGVAIADLFPRGAANTDQTATIVRGEARNELQLWRSGIRKQLLTPFEDGATLNLFLVELEPGASTGDEQYAHRGEEAGLVLSGAIQLSVEAETWRLAEGDSFRFRSSRPHRFSNADAGVTRVLWVNSL
jgi:transcriptional regulator with XRE-family HTH domain